MIKEIQNTVLTSPSTWLLSYIAYAILRIASKVGNSDNPHKGSFGGGRQLHDSGSLCARVRLQLQVIGVKPPIGNLANPLIPALGGFDCATGISRAANLNRLLQTPEWMAV